MLLRTDIFETLASANKNKVRQDNAIELDWRGDPRRPRDAMLTRLANLRASHSLGVETDIFLQFFPKKFLGKNFIKYCLEMTRHTPRDFLQLMKYFQQSCGEGKFTLDNVRNAFRVYSVNYFLPEIKDELHGYLDVDDQDAIFEALASMSERDFRLSQLQEWVPENFSKDKLRLALHALFECSAIGNVRQIRGRHIRYLVFRYRNRHAAFRDDERIILHRALWRAFNLPLEKVGPDIDEDMHVEDSELAQERNMISRVFTRTNHR